MRQDFLLDADGDIKIVNGDLIIGESDQQHVELLLSTSPNDWKENPVTGAAMIKSLGGNLSGFAKRNVAVQLEADGYAVNSIEENENGINVTARIL
jgi:hypothetical protein